MRWYTVYVTFFRVKRTVRIGGALIVGIVIILIALRVSSTNSSAASEVVVLDTPTRTYIESLDSNGDGIKDWEETLNKQFVDATPAPEEGASAQGTDPYVPPTTFTGKFSEAFFQDYLDGKTQGSDFSDPTAFIGNAVQAIEQNTQSKKHSRLELTVIPSDSDSIREYGNALALILQKNASHGGKSEAEILENALRKNDPSALSALDPIYTMYTQSIKDALLIEVPDALIEQHLVFLNAVEACATNVQAMKETYTDPLLSLARLKEYNNTKKALYTSFKNFALAFNEEGIFFENGEPSRFFYLFENIQNI